MTASFILTTLLWSASLLFLISLFLMYLNPMMTLYLSNWIFC